MWCEKFVDVVVFDFEGGCDDVVVYGLWGL